MMTPAGARQALKLWAVTYVLSESQYLIPLHSNVWPREGLGECAYYYRGITLATFGSMG